MFETCTHTAKSPIIPTNEIDTEPRSNDANIFSTRADDEAITTFAPAGGLNTLFFGYQPNQYKWKAFKCAGSMAKAVTFPLMITNSAKRILLFHKL